MLVSILDVKNVVEVLMYEKGKSKFFVSVLPNYEKYDLGTKITIIIILLLFTLHYIKSLQ